MTDNKLKTCPDCKGHGRKYNDYGGSDLCSKCNGKGEETPWICRAGKHKSQIFDDIKNDPRMMPCRECGLHDNRYYGVGYVEVLREGDPEFIRRSHDAQKERPTTSYRQLPHHLGISYEDEMELLKGEIDEFTAIKYSETKKGNLYFMVGLPRAGKSTLMNKWKSEGPNRVIICFDNIRLALYEKDHLQQMEPFMWEFGLTMANTLLLSGYDIMMDDTHTSKWKRDHYKTMGGHGMYLNTPLDVCLKRAPQAHVEFLAAINRMAGRLENFNPKAENIAVVDWKSLDRPQ
jgi:predicted kinase/predicted nucleic-acid-binding Zn-ribbon protein